MGRPTKEDVELTLCGAVILGAVARAMGKPAEANDFAYGDTRRIAWAAGWRAQKAAELAVALVTQGGPSEHLE